MVRHLQRPPHCAQADPLKLLEERFIKTCTRLLTWSVDSPDVVVVVVVVVCAHTVVCLCRRPLPAPAVFRIQLSAALSVSH